MSAGLIPLAFVAFLDVGLDPLSEFVDRMSVSLDQVNRLRYPWMSVCWTYVVTLNDPFGILFVCGIDLLFRSKISFDILYQYGIVFFFFFHMILSSAKRVGSSILFSGCVQDLELVFSEGFCPSDLSSVQLLCCSERSQVLVVCVNREV